jgi:hypothetical protein
MKPNLRLLFPKKAKVKLVQIRANAELIDQTRAFLKKERLTWRQFLESVMAGVVGEVRRK